MAETVADAAALARASQKVRVYLLPFLMVSYFAAYLDRVNVGFAALEMNTDLGLGAEAFGFAAGIFFLGYVLFEVPSNLALRRFGARIWIARIMVTWGLVSLAMAWVTDITSLVIVRFLLGVAEAGFFPGIIYYLTYWVPAKERAHVVSLFMVAVPVSSVLGAPLSGWILDAFQGVGGLKGWQWLFVIEAVPSIVLGVMAFFVLPDKPRDARWLRDDEKRSLEAKIEAEIRLRESLHSFTLKQAVKTPRVIALSLIYFGLVTGMYGLSFWMPQILKSFGLTNTEAGFLTAVPFLGASIFMILWGRHSDMVGERIWHIVLPAFVGGAALVACTQVSGLLPSLALLTIAAVGVFTALPLFWTLPTALLSGAAAAGGIALINSIGNVGGFAGPYLIGWIKASGFETSVAVASLASFAILAGLLVLAIGHDERLERS